MYDKVVLCAFLQRFSLTIKENPMEILHLLAHISVSVCSLTSENSTIMTQASIFREKKLQQCVWADTTSFSSTAIFKAISLCIRDTGMSHATAPEAHPQALAP